MMPEKETMRLFIALEPSAGFKSALMEVQARLRAAGIGARYYDPAALHLTLAFIGQWPEDISPLLPPVEAPFPLTLSHLGVFPEAKVLGRGWRPRKNWTCWPGACGRRWTIPASPTTEGPSAPTSPWDGSPGSRRARRWTGSRCLPPP